ncbi:nitrite reductase, copper-containing [Natrarchaeobius halalkaliphilus]|uniref:Copper-containing nitrite reductase n=1 Tax=Natrarchaeobius halalkaliphilus TaxID=1679091 RepID=A0A3N6LPW9_9EURY|nr:copper-containing nitrite reductase [Natrarchaeobius halalkaliphilus]RQG91588.1 nitrite reductase, copper-containing [Natrarchaeobius halalkaliphilus]
MTISTATRRTFMQAAGATGAVAVAGCLTGERVENDPEPEASDADEGLRPAEAVDVDRIGADPADVPPPVDWNEPRTHEFTLETVEVTAEIEPGVTVEYMTYEGQIPGPMIRVREGDTIDLTFEVPDDLNRTVHNVDFHAVYGPGGGAEATTIRPGDEPARLQFETRYPGVHIYHCAVPAMDQHISLGMFGAILVEPKDGLPEVDREFYFGQHELYTDGEMGEEGHHHFDFDASADEEPTYVLLNGEAYGFTEDGQHGPVEAEVGETVRVYFANGGPNFTSAWHPIGNVWSRLYRDGDLLTEPARYVETSPIAPGTVVAGEMELPVPGPIKIVDHALSRVVHRGALATIDVEGEPNPDVYDEDP